MTPKPDYGLTSDLYDYALGLVSKPFTTMQLHNGKRTMHLEVDEDTYWNLVKLGADIQMDHESYAEHILIGHVETELDRKTED